MAVTEKRPLDETVYSTQHIVMDIEGTTTSISFVKDTLFPYVRKNLDSYLNSHWDEEEFQGALALLKDQASEDKKANMDGVVEIPSVDSIDEVKAAVVKNVLWQMDADRKTTALKKLQGQMWRQGYKSGELKGHLFADVAPTLREWVKDGRKLYIYSSGSVEAQKLLFGHSADGDLTELFTDFFDTEVGAKGDADSYKAIVRKLSCNADDVLFLTDMPKEASAAREAGLPAILVEREGNDPLATELRREFSAVSSFQDLQFETSIKKQKVNPEGDEEQLPKNGHTNGGSEGTMDVDPAKGTVEADVKGPAPEMKADAMDVDVESKETTTKQATDAAEESGDLINKEKDGNLESAENKKCETRSKSGENSEDTDAKAEDSQISNEAKGEKKIESNELPDQLDASDTNQKLEAGNEKSDMVSDEVVNKEPGDKTADVSTSEPSSITVQKTDEDSKLKTEDDIKSPVQETVEMETDTEKLLPKDDKKTEGGCEEISERKEEKTELTKLKTCEEEVKEVKDCVKDETIDLKENKKDDDIKVKGMDEIPKTETEVEVKKTEVEVKKTEVEVKKTEVEVKKTEVEVTKTEVEVTKTEVEVTKTEVEVKKTEVEPCEKPVTKEAQETNNVKVVDESELKEATVETAKVEVGGNTEDLEKEKESKTKGENVDESKEKLNGVTNGTNGVEAKETADTNGAVENGHGKIEKADVPEVIAAKNTSQIDKVGVDADVVVEA